MFSSDWGNFQVSNKRGGNKKHIGNSGWGGGQNNSNGWGQQNNNSNGWEGQQNNNSNGWGQQNNNSNGWGGQQNNSNGWGGGQQNNNSNGWGGGQQNNEWGNQQNNQWGQQNNQWGGQQNNQWGGSNGSQNSNQWGGNGQMGFINPGSQQAWGNNLQGAQWINQQMNNHQFNMINPSDINIGDIIEKQIILVEPSPAKKRLQELRQKGQQFVDDDFPPNNRSLSGEWGRVSEWDQIKWEKISQKIQGSKIFVDKPEPRDIKQGYLGNCYYLAGLAALAERPDRIFNLFMLTEKNQLNYYQVKILYKGKWMTIDLDQYVPFIHGSPAFSKSVDRQLWVILLEKAWSKLYTSYKRTEAGYPQEPLHDLTGAPIRQLFMQKKTYNKEQQWQYLLKASALQYSMVCSSNPGSDTKKSQSGVVQGHAYTLLNAVQMKFQGQLIRLIQLRNPWGKGEFQGQWSDNDPRWNQVDPNERKRIGFNKQVDDGIFFIPFETFWQEFRAVTIAEINDNASYVYKSYNDPNKQGCFFKIKIEKQGNYSLQVDKTPERSFEDKLQQAYQYPMATVSLGCSNGGGMQKLQGFASRKRTTHQKYDMSPGTYIVKVHLNFDSQWQKDFDVILAVYGDYPCLISLATNQEASALEGRQVSWTGQEQQAHNWNKMSSYTPDNQQGGNQWGGQQEGNQWGQQGGNEWGGQQGGNQWGGQQGNNQWGGQQGGNNWDQSNNNNWGQQGGNGW